MGRNLNPYAVWNIPTASKRVNTVELIQRGTVSMTVSTTTATITSVDTAKSTLAFLGMNTGVNSLLYFPLLTLTNGTTITLGRGTTDTSATTVNFEVYTRP